jgi:hypothetical protein
MPYIWILVTFWYDSFWRRVRPDKFGLRAEKPSAIATGCPNGNQRIRRMTRTELLLAVLAAADGAVYKPAQLQKTVFLITQNTHLINRGPGFDFQPYNYGPFDKAVYQEAEILKSHDLAAIEPSGYGQWNVYSATQDGLNEGREILARIPDPLANYIRDISRWVRSVSFSTLVKSIYEQYPGMRVNSIFQG